MTNIVYIDPNNGISNFEFVENNTIVVPSFLSNKSDNNSCFILNLETDSEKQRLINIYLSIKDMTILSRSISNLSRNSGTINLSYTNIVHPRERCMFKINNVLKNHVLYQIFDNTDMKLKLNLKLSSFYKYNTYDIEYVMMEPVVYYKFLFFYRKLKLVKSPLYITRTAADDMYFTTKLLP